MVRLLCWKGGFCGFSRGKVAGWLTFRRKLRPIATSPLICCISFRGLFRVLSNLDFHKLSVFHYSVSYLALPVRNRRLLYGRFNRLQRFLV